MGTGAGLSRRELPMLRDIAPIVNSTPETVCRELKRLVPAEPRRARPIARHELDFARGATGKPIKVALPGPYLLTRVLAYCLEYTEGLEMSRGLAEPDEPALMVRDLTGALQAWIEVGSPDAARLHKASKAAPRNRHSRTGCRAAPGARCSAP